MDDRQQCQHQACHCTGSDVRTDGYCSDSCSQQQMKDEKCACGHSDCR